MEQPIREGFFGSLDPRLSWHCPPAEWEVDTAKGCLRLHTDAETDFWQRTHYGFQADNGHFLYASVQGNFRLVAQVRFEAVHQYDQAGIMLRHSPDCWLKSSVEHELDRPDRLGAVVTNGGYSDWSTQDIEDCREMWFRVHREAADYVVEASRDGAAWTQLRVARLHEDNGRGAVQCGVYACSPKGAGFAPEFHLLEIHPA